MAYASTVFWTERDAKAKADENKAKDAILPGLASGLFLSRLIYIPPTLDAHNTYYRLLPVVPDTAPPGLYEAVHKIRDYRNQRYQNNDPCRNRRYVFVLAQVTHDYVYDARDADNDFIHQTSAHQINQSFTGLYLI